MDCPLLLPTAYLPNLFYLKQFIEAPVVLMEAHENFVKQSCRNRCDILSSNGKITLSVPLIKQSEKECISTKRISYAEKWQHQHWRTITTAYKSAPYFEFFEDDFKPFYHTKFEFLFDYNMQLLQTILNILRVKKNIDLTEEYHATYPQLRDLRNSNFNDEQAIKPYHQVFENKFEFTPHLSCIDALFNEGLHLKNL